VQRLDVAGVGSEFGLSLIFSELADSMGAFYNKSTITNGIVMLNLTLKNILSLFAYCAIASSWGQNNDHEIRRIVPK
jgi:hypothetical protein